MEDVFDFVVGGSWLFGKGKAIRHLLKKEEIEPAIFLYIGDAVRDAKAAKQAGVDVAAVGWESTIGPRIPDAPLVVSERRAAGSIERTGMTTLRVIRPPACALQGNLRL